MGQVRPNVRGKRIFHSNPFQPDPGTNAKKIAENFKKLKNIIQASLQAETDPDRPKNRENFFSVLVFFYPTRVTKYKNNRKKFSKN